MPDQYTPAYNLRGQASVMTSRGEIICSNLIRESTIKKGDALASPFKIDLVIQLNQPMSALVH